MKKETRERVDLWLVVGILILSLLSLFGIEGEKLGVSNQTLGRWEKDPKQVTLEMILKMCELYRIDLESLFLK